jgi:hypothetical protein
MGFAELINVIEKLPPERQAEVFDFAEFLAARFASAGATGLPPTDWKNAYFSQLSFEQAMRGMEDEPVLYCREDLKETWK